jgi:ubiquinone/menaquinone biosynthesis C-methylase UbiE
MTTPAHIAKNHAYWNRISAEYQRTHESQLGIVEPTWGVWAIPERELQVLGDVAGKDVLELGCGGAQWSVALARRGARVTGLDLSEEQIRHAEELARREGVSVSLVCGSAEEAPFEDRSFDVVFCDHGAMTFADPRRTVPEVARLLRPGGLFAFNAASPIMEIAYDLATGGVGERLVRDYFTLDAVEEEDGAVSFVLPYGAWIKLFRGAGLAVEDLIEIKPPEGATTTYEGYVSLAWARRWPAEQIWRLRRE